MRLGDINDLSAHALNNDMKRRVGWNFGDIHQLSIVQASAMLESIDGKISGFRHSKQLHESEKSTTLGGLVLAKQVLEAYIAEKAKHGSKKISEKYSKKSKTDEVVSVKEGSGPKEKQRTPYVDRNSPEYKAAADKQKQKMQKDKAAKPGKELLSKIEKKKETNEADDAQAKAAAIRSRRDIEIKGQKARHGINRKPGESLAAFIARSHKLKKKKAVKESIDFDKALIEGYSRMEQMVDDAFGRMLGRLNAMTKMTRSDGALAKNIEAIGGDAAYLNDAQQAIDDAYDAVGEAHYGAMGHIVDEDASQGVFEDEVGQAETLMAAQDMVDSIQGMLEDVGEMVNEKLPPLTDSIRRSGGAEAATAFNQQTNDALAALMDAVRAARESMAGAVGTLSGDAPTPMAGVDTVDTSNDLDLDLEEPTDTDDVDLDDFTASDAAVGGDEPLGRAKRD